MKKSFLFASFIAMVAILATSCNQKPAVDAPKARFTWAADGLVVTFTNASKDAETYAWDFGDGATSTEVNPVHEYAAIGEYTVTLTAKNAGGENKITDVVLLEKKAVEIKVDGSFADWAAADPTVVASAVADENSAYEEFYAMKFCTDLDYLYFYLEYNGATYEYLDDAGQPAVGFVVEPISFYFDLDDDPLTGSNSWLWENSAAEFLIQGMVADLTASGLYFFASEDQTAWGWTDTGASGIVDAACTPVDLGNGHHAVEGRIMLAKFTQTPKVIKVGVYTSNTEWSENGVLPQVTIDDDGNQIPSPLLNVVMAK